VSLLSFDGFVEWAKSAVVTVGQSFTEPDDDWMPTALVQNADSIVVAGLDPSFFGSTEAKDNLADEVLPALLRKYEAQRVALVMSSWMVSGKSEDVDMSVRPSENPNRVEVVVVTVIDRDNAGMYVAEILRGKEPPILGEWDAHLAEGDGMIDGRFVEPVRRALCPQG
jgi:hypothetical protein